MPRRARRKSKFVTKRGLPFQLMKYAETKQVTETQTDVVLPITGLLLSLNDLSQGVLDSERIGTEIQTRSVFARYYMRLTTAAASGFAIHCRFILYTPRVSNSANAPVTDMRDIVDKDQFIVWSDKWMQVGSDRLTGGLVTIKHKWKPYMKTIYAGTGATGTRKGKLLLLIIPSIGNIALLNGYSTLFYKDL